jgi:hypothetical protein
MNRVTGESIEAINDNYVHFIGTHQFPKLI